jgi:uncharacterized membrane protein
MNWKTLVGALVLGAGSLVPKTSFASFEICNRKTNGADMWVTYAYYEPNVSTVHTDDCSSYETLYSPSYFTAWKNTGWWYLTPNQCATVYSPAVSNTRAYVYADITDGSTLIGTAQPGQGAPTHVPFLVDPNAFAIDQYITPVFQGSDPVETTGDGQCLENDMWTVSSAEIWQAGNTNWVLNID